MSHILEAIAIWCLAASLRLNPNRVGSSFAFAAFRPTVEPEPETFEMPTVPLVTDGETFEQWHQRILTEARVPAAQIPYVPPAMPMVLVNESKPIKQAADYAAAEPPTKRFKRGAKAVLNEKVDEAVRLISAEGVSVREAAKQVGVAESTIRRRLKTKRGKSDEPFLAQKVGVAREG